MKIRSHFKHNVFMLDEVGNLLEHLGGRLPARRRALRGLLEALASGPDSDERGRSDRL
jgi:hypothetical protein